MAFGANRLEVKAMQPQIVIVLKIVHCGDVVRVLEPSNIVRPRVLADQEVTGDFGDRRSTGAMGAHFVLRALLPPIHAVI